MVVLASQDVNISRLNAQLVQAQKDRLGSSEISMLQTQNDSLSIEVMSFTQLLLETHVDGNARMSLLL